MYELIIKENQTPIEIALGIDEQGMTTARKLYEFLELDQRNYSRWCKMNILENEFADEGVDFHSSQMTSEGRGNFAQDFKLTASFAKKLSMTAKSEKGEQARQYFIKAEDKLKEVVIQINQLPPEMQMFKKIFDQQAKHYLEMEQLKESNQAVIKKVDSIREIVALNPIDWRKESTGLINKMALNLGGYEHIRVIREESYKLLEQRFGVALNIRLTNKKKTMALNGVAKSKLDKLNPLDVITEDKKLVEGYTQIIKEMAIKYKVA